MGADCGDIGGAGFGCLVGLLQGMGKQEQPGRITADKLSPPSVVCCYMPRWSGRCRSRHRNRSSRVMAEAKLFMRFYGKNFLISRNYMGS